MNILIVGLSHKTAPVEFRERLAFSEEQQKEALHRLVGLDPVNEAVLFSTCNRTELYLVVDDIDEGKIAVTGFLAEHAGVDANELGKYLYNYSGDGGVRHLFRVVSSLESMVLGEAQILGQAKDAYELAFNEGTTDTVMNHLLRHAFSVGKRVRSETAIGESAVSISFAAVELAKQVFGSLEGHSVMVVGAGEMSELTVMHLIDNGIKEVIVTNRTFERAQDLAAKFKGRAVEFESMFEAMEKADIVITSTGSKMPIIDKASMAKTMKARRHRPIFLIDIAVPRDIDPDANKARNVFLYDIDDLQQVVDANMVERSREAEKAQVMVEDEVEEFLKWQNSLEVVPTIKALRDYIEGIRSDEFMKACEKMEISEEDREKVETMTRQLINKILHEPTVQLKGAAHRKDGPSYVDAIRYLFGLDGKS